MTTRCKICDFTEDRSIPSIFHDSTTENDKPRKWTEERDGFVCSVCHDAALTEETPVNESEFEVLIEDDWPEDWGKEPLRKGWY